MNELVSWLNAAGETFVTFAGRMVIQSSVLVLLLVVLDLILRKRVKAVVRYWIWLLVLVKLMLPPSLSSPTSLAWWAGDTLPEAPSALIKVVQQPTAASRVAKPIQHVPPGEIAGPAPTTDSATPHDVSPSPTVSEAATLVTEPVLMVSPTWEALVLLGWLLAVLLMAVLLIQRVFFVRGLLAQSEGAPEAMLALLERCRRQMRVGNGVKLRLTSVSTSPSVCGLFRPTILMPRPMVQRLNTQQLKSILLHELAHIKRGDLWVSLVQTVLQIVYLYHPLLWFANARIRKVREQAVDETVLAAMGNEAEDYPRTLLSVSKLAFGRPALSLRLIGVVESKRALTARIKHIVSRPFPKSAKLGLAGLVLVATIAAVLLPMARTERSENPARFTEAEISAGLTSLQIDPGDRQSLSVSYWHEGLDLDSASAVPAQTDWPAGVDVRFTAELKKGRRVEDFVAVSLGKGDIDDVQGRRILTLDSDDVGAAAAELTARFKEFHNSRAVMNGFYTDDLPTFFAVLSDGVVAPAAQFNPRGDSPATGPKLWLIRMAKAHAQDVSIEYWQGVFPKDKTGEMTSSPDRQSAAKVTPKQEELSQNDQGESALTRTIQGIVTDTLGRPRECVYVAPQGQPIWEGVMSDAQGRFILENVTPDQKVGIAFSQACHLYGIFRLPPTPSSGPLRVTLDLDEGDLVGRVVGADGKALADQKVELVVTTTDGIRLALAHRPKTDVFGYYSSDGPCGEGVTIEVRTVDTDEAATSFSTGSVKVRAGQGFIEMPLLVAAGKKIQPDFDRNLRNDGMLHCRGRVVDEDGEPIAGVRVGMSFDMPRWMSTWVRDAMTDDQGRWHRAVPPQCMDLSLGFEHPEYYIDGERGKPARAELEKGTHVVTMKRGLVLRGTVVNEQGEPVENALVCADRYYSRTPSPYNQLIENATTARTFRDGTFRIGGLPPGPRTITTYSSSYAPTLQTVDIQANMSDIAVVLSKGGTYRGRVVDCKGQPIEDVRIGVTDWRLGKERHDMSRLARTDAKGNFALTNLPEGQIELYFGKKPLMGFHRGLPKDLSQVDELVMYEVPVFTGRVVDAETGEPIPEFSIANGFKRRRQDAPADWSRYHRGDTKEANGTFTHRWGGYGISYPTSIAACIKIQAPGYLPAIAPPLELGAECEPLTIRLRRGTPITGTVRTPDGSAAAKAQIALVRSGEKAFIDRYQFSERGFAYQAEIVERTDENGAFELPPTEEQGLLVAVHESGYAQVPSTEFANGSDLALTAWSRVEGVIDRSCIEETNVEIALYALDRNTDRSVPSITWLFDRVSPTGDTFALEFLPAIPVAVGRIARYEMNDGTYLIPEAGQTYTVAVGAQGRAVTGRIGCRPQFLKTKSISLTDPRQTHAVAFRIDEGAMMPSGIGTMDESSFTWLWRDKERVYGPSQTVRKRFVPRIAEDGEFTFAGLPSGEYEFVVNIHAPLGENVSCGRGVLEGVAVTRFTVPKGQSKDPLRVPDVQIRLLTYPGVGEAAPRFEAKTFDGQTVRLEDLRGKVVLLDFWATWCSPCVAALPKMQALHDALADEEHFAMIGLSLDWDLERARRLIDEKELDWTQVSLGSMDESIVVKQYGIGGVPTTVLIDAEGEIVARGASLDELKQQIEKALHDVR